MGIDKTRSLKNWNLRQTCDAYALNNESPHSSIRAISPPTALARSETKSSVSSACDTFSPISAKYYSITSFPSRVSITSLATH